MNEESVVVRNGITVTKSFSPDDFPVPAVTFDVSSTRDQPVELRITDAIPQDFGVEQIGFHPEYGSEHWTATGDGEVQFERTLDPEETFTTVYGVRMGEDDEPSVFLQKPTVEVDPSGPGAEASETVPEESSAVVRELARGERESVPGLEATPDETDQVKTDEQQSVESAETSGQTEPQPEPTEADDPLTEPMDAVSGEEEDVEEMPVEESDDEYEAEFSSDATAEEPIETGTPAEDTIETEPPSEDLISSADASDEPDEPELLTDESQPESTDERPEPRSMTPTTETDSFVATVAAEIEAGTASEEDLAVIREALVEDRTSDQVRLEHLQSRVSDLEAYSDALEAFIDENGRAWDLLDSLETEIETFEEDIDGIESRMEDAATDRDQMHEHLERLEDTVEAIAGVAEQIEDLRSDVESIDGRVDDIESLAPELEDLEDEVETIRSDLQDVTEWRDQLSDVFG